MAGPAERWIHGQAGATGGVGRVGRRGGGWAGERHIEVQNQLAVSFGAIFDRGVTAHTPDAVDRWGPQPGARLVAAAAGVGGFFSPLALDISNHGDENRGATAERMAGLGPLRVNLGVALLAGVIAGRHGQTTRGGLTAKEREPGEER